MQTYKNDSGKSGVLAYKNGEDYIVIQFKHGRETFYKYTNASAGSTAISHMKRLADAGSGLNTYIASKATQPAHAAKSTSLAGVL